MKKIILFTLLIFHCVMFSQVERTGGKTIKIIHSDFTDKNEIEVPGALILLGNVKVQQDSLKIFCNKAYYYQTENYIKLFGNVKLIQDDTLQLDSKYAEYNGSQQIAYSSGNVVMKSPSSKLTTNDKVYYDRMNGVAYYENNATIVNKKNVLKSKSGRYYTTDKKFEFRTNVDITTPTTKIKSDNLDYYETNGHAFIFAPSTVVSKDHYIYTENGFYDTKQDIGKLKKKSHIITNNRRIEGDEMYYEKKIGYSKAINNVKLTDTINKMIVTSHFAELYQKKEGDSIYINKKPFVRMLFDKDSTFFYAKNIIISGKDKERLMRGYPNARMFRDPDMSGKADSIHFNQKIGLTQLIGNPVIFKKEGQLTGQLIHLKNDLITNKLDSLKVLTDAFLIEKDSLGSGYNQAKGINLYGKFKDGKISRLDLIQNAEMIYYAYDENDEFIGIDKGICSKIHLEFENGKISTATRFTDPQGDTYPDDKLPQGERKLQNFVLREDEKINSKEEVVPKEE